MTTDFHLDFFSTFAPLPSHAYDWPQWPYLQAYMHKQLLSDSITNKQISEALLFILIVNMDQYRKSLFSPADDTLYTSQKSASQY